MNGRTYSREDWFQAKAKWESFGPRWAGVRRAAADRGILFPPSGTAHDDRDAAEPSQRAIVWRALEDNPTELHRIIGRSRSWNGVVAGIIGLEARLREDADWRDRDTAADKADLPTHREAAMSLAAILRRVEDSVA